MVTQSKGSATGSIFTSSPPNSAFGRTLRNNMDNNSFLKWGTQSKTILSNSKTAVFMTSNSMKNNDEYKDCRVRTYVSKLFNFKYIDMALNFVKNLD